MSSSADEGIDEAFAPFRENVLAYAQISGELRSEEAGFSVSVEAIEIDTPLELDVYAPLEAGAPLALGCAPPLYRLATSIEPVFHRLRLTLVPASELEEGAGP